MPDAGRHVNVVALARRGQRYVFFIDDDSFDLLTHQLNTYVNDPELDFDEDDAAIVYHRAWKLTHPTAP